MVALSTGQSQVLYNWFSQHNSFHPGSDNTCCRWLTEEQYSLLDGSERLNDLIIDTAQSTLAQQFPKKAGFWYMFHFQSATRPVEKQVFGTYFISNLVEFCCSVPIIY